MQFIPVMHLQMRGGLIKTPILRPLSVVDRTRPCEGLRASSSLAGGIFRVSKAEILVQFQVRLTSSNQDTGNGDLGGRPSNSEGYSLMVGRCPAQCICAGIRRLVSFGGKNAMVQMYS